MAESFPPNSIFMCYRRADSEEMVDRIYDTLAAGFGEAAIFRDIDNIPPGVDFPTYIQESLRGCPVALVFIGKEWASCTDGRGRRRIDDPGDHVRIEVETALALPGARVIPVFVRHAEIPGEDELPESLRPLRRRNGITVRSSGPDYKHDIARLSKVLEDAVKGVLAARQAAAEELRREEAEAREREAKEQRERELAEQRRLEEAAAAETFERPQTQGAAVEELRAEKEPENLEIPSSEFPPKVHLEGDAVADTPGASRIGDEGKATAEAEPATPTQASLPSSGESAVLLAPRLHAPVTVPVRRKTRGLASAIAALGVVAVIGVAIWRSSLQPPATNDVVFVNSLGMRFVPVAGTQVRFSIWDTRVSDWQAFIQEEGDTEQSGILGVDEKNVEWVIKKELSWKNPGFEQTGQHPVVGVSWQDARRFCAWLSKKEGRTYRLPADAEWSAAVGPQKYPWGDDYPPSTIVGNYCGSESRLKTDVSGMSAWTTIKGYDDGFPRTSPVGSFAANRYGLYDMGGNVWQWCDDAYVASMNSAEAIAKYQFLKEDKANDGSSLGVLRGASWGDEDEIVLRSAFRYGLDAGTRSVAFGFRCVLVVSGG